MEGNPLVELTVNSEEEKLHLKTYVPINPRIRPRFLEKFTIEQN